MGTFGGPKFYTIESARREFGEVANDLLDGIISNETTILYGASQVGKGRLINELVASGLTGQPFGSRAWSRPLERVAIITTDAGGPREYTNRLDTAGVGIEYEESFRFYPVDSAPSAGEWAELTGSIVGWGPSLVVLDSTTEAVDGSVNEDTAVKALWRALAPFHRVGASVPLVLVHHVAKPSAENGGRRGQTPVGSGLWENYSRNRILMRPAFSAEGGDVTLELRPRWGEPWLMHLDNAPGGRLTVASATSAAELGRRKEQSRRDKDGRNVEVADWIVANCQGCNKRQTAEKVAAEFPSVGKVEPIRQRLSNGRDFGGLLELDNGLWSRIGSARP